MPGTNLTRDEAQTRAGLLAVESYTVDLDLTVSDKVFESTTVLRFTCSEPGASTFADLVGATVHEVVLNGEKLDAFDVYRDSRIRLDDLQADNELRVLCELPLQPHRRGSAPLRRPGRRQDLPLHPVRGAGRPARVHHLRAARPQVGLHLHRDGAGPLGGRVQRPDARARGAGRRQGGLAVPGHPSGSRRTSPRSSPASTTRSTTPTRARTAPSSSATTAARAWSTTSTATPS